MSSRRPVLNKVPKVLPSHASAKPNSPHADLALWLFELMRERSLFIEVPGHSGFCDHGSAFPTGSRFLQSLGPVLCTWETLGPAIESHGQWEGGWGRRPEGMMGRAAKAKAVVKDYRKAEGGRSAAPGGVR